MTAEHVLAKDIAAFERMRAELQEHHSDKFVVFHDGRLQGSFDTFDSAARDALKRFHDAPFLIRQVGAPEVMPMPASVAFRPAMRSWIPVPSKAVSTLPSRQNSHCR